LDPGTATTGYGIIKETDTEAFRHRKSGVIRTTPEMSHSERLDAIYSSVKTLVERFDPQVAVVEEIYFNKNVKTAISVSQARGAILLALNHSEPETGDELFVEEMNPSKVKKTLTGSGSANKHTMQQIVKQELGLGKVPEPDDAADGLAMAVSYSLKKRFRENLEEQ
jgi:crossover junction endodeoxyribonuclease RuvC